MMYNIDEILQELSGSIYGFLNNVKQNKVSYILMI